MTRFVIRGLVLVALTAVVVLFPASAGPQQKGKKKKPDGVDNIVGTQWTFKVLDPKTDSEEFGRFRSDGVNLFRGAQQVGTYKQTGPQTVKVTFTGLKLKGEVELRLTKTKPLTWRGQLHRADGTKDRLRLIIRDD